MLFRSAESFKQINPKIKIIGVEPTNSNLMTRSINSNKPETLEPNNKSETIADSLAPPFIGKIAFEYVKKYVDDIINVSEIEIIESTKEIMNKLKVIAEPGAAACFAPILHRKLNIRKKSKCLVLLCGGNIDLNKVAKLF